MRTVSVREFSYNPSAILAEVEQGETIEVTKHGKTIAVISPPPAEEMSGYDRLVAEGVIIPPPGGPRTVGQMLETFEQYKNVQFDEAKAEAYERWSARADERREELFRRIIMGEDISTLDDDFPDLQDDEEDAGS